MNMVKINHVSFLHDFILSSRIVFCAVPSDWISRVRMYHFDIKGRRIQICPVKLCNCQFTVKACSNLSWKIYDFACIMQSGCNADCLGVHKLPCGWLALQLVNGAVWMQNLSLLFVKPEIAWMAFENLCNLMRQPSGRRLKTNNWCLNCI